MFLSLVKKRRSIRKFKPVPVSREMVDQLVEVALRAFSSRGINPWQFIVVDDPRLLAALSKSKPHGAAFLKHAPLAIVVLADPEKSDVWVEDTAIAATLLHLATVDLGLGSCWVQIRKRDFDATTSAEAHIKDLLNIPDPLKVASILAVGHPDEEKPPHPAASLQKEKVHLNTC